MKLLFDDSDNRKILTVKNIYDEILQFIAQSASKGKRNLSIYILDDDFNFKHTKPIVDKLSVMTGLEIYSEGSSLLRPSIHIKY